MASDPQKSQFDSTMETQENDLDIVEYSQLRESVKLGDANGSVLKAEDEESRQSMVTIPSFGSRLNITDFMFMPKTESVDNTLNSSPRRSVRLLPSSSQPASPVITSATSSPRKRKAPKEDDYIQASSTFPTKRSRSRIAAAPASAYAHLPLLPDAIGPDLLVLFVGLNPGIQTAIQGHAYAHPSNLFWKLLHSSGCTTRRCLPSEDQDLPRLFSLGNTNIVPRPTRNGAELSRKEMDENVGLLEDKVRKWKPEAVAIVGKGIWESIWRVRHGKAIGKAEFRWGWQVGVDERMGAVKGEWDGARVFVATSTSGLAASLRPGEKEVIWRELGVWVERRREERGLRIKDENNSVKTEDTT